MLRTSVHLLLATVAVCTFCSSACSNRLAAQQAQTGAGVQQQQKHAVAVGNAANGDAMQPPVWPEQFKSVMFQNRTNRLALVTLYYDWQLGANLNIISSQLGGTVWDLEWNNVRT